MPVTARRWVFFLGACVAMLMDYLADLVLLPLYRI
jgi:hypothetical protein